MKAVKKMLALGITVSMLAGMAGCGSEKSKEVKEEDSKDVTLTFMASQDWVQDAEVELGKKFTEETGIKVDYQIVPADQYTSLLMTKLNTGECTDIFGSQGGKFDIQTQLNIAKNGVDLSGESWAGNVDELVAAEISADGKLYGQPMNDLSNVWAVAYNKNILKELDLEIPTDYASFDAVCKKILDAGITPIYECVSDGWHHTLWFPECAIAAETAEPGLAEKLNANEAKFEGNQTMVTILEQMKDMIDKGYWGQNYMSNAYVDTAKNIASGEYAMTIAQQGLGQEVNAADAEFDAEDIGYFVMPLAVNQKLNVSPVGPTRFVYSGSKHQEEAKQYLEFMAREESLAFMTEEVARFNKLPFKNAPSGYLDSVQEFHDRYSEEDTVYQVAVKYVNPQWNQIGADLSAMFLGEVTPEELLKNIDKMRSEQAAAANDEAWK